ncbi:hypothetical protein LAZ67_2006519 [Cordylochernes scorpioides]|uniref:Uncharacterized protein n=1 Tax=Cordylochernes scorpioides TaxID=51811 RepID=A0ABY6K5I7_9ARAC|nr:hypothetical protein LAZ67_2006519 [Cordylochernes scorpioides]
MLSYLLRLGKKTSLKKREGSLARRIGATRLGHCMLGAEVDCAQLENVGAGITCDGHAHRCRNGQCLPQYAFCNAVTDCADGSDEDLDTCEQGEKCPSHAFQCYNKRCRSSAILCSGMDGCGDGSDEDRCEVCCKFFYCRLHILQYQDFVVYLTQTLYKLGPCVWNYPLSHYTPLLKS